MRKGGGNLTEFERFDAFSAHDPPTASTMGAPHRQTEWRVAYVACLRARVVLPDGSFLSLGQFVDFLSAPSESTR